MANPQPTPPPEPYFNEQFGVTDWLAAKARQFRQGASRGAGMAMNAITTPVTSAIHGAQDALYGADEMAGNRRFEHGQEAQHLNMLAQQYMSRRQGTEHAVPFSQALKAVVDAGGKDPDLIAAEVPWGPAMEERALESALLKSRRVRLPSGEVGKVPASQFGEPAAGRFPASGHDAVWQSGRADANPFAEQVAAMDRSKFPAKTSLNSPQPVPIRDPSLRLPQLEPTPPPPVPRDMTAWYTPTGESFPAGGRSGPGVIYREYPMIEHPGSPPPLPPRAPIERQPLVREFPAYPAERGSLNRPSSLPTPGSVPTPPPAVPQGLSVDEAINAISGGKPSSVRYKGPSWLEGGEQPQIVTKRGEPLPFQQPGPELPMPPDSGAKTGGLRDFQSVIKETWNRRSGKEKMLAKTGAALSAVQLARMVNDVNNVQQQKPVQRKPDQYDDDVKAGVLTADEAAQMREYEAAHAH